MKNCIELNLPFLPLADTFDISSIPDNEYSATMYEKDILSDEFIKWIDANGFQFYRAIVFALPPGSVDQQIHIDGIGPGAVTFGINWNLNSTNFLIRWYKPLTEGTTVIIGRFMYCKFNDDEVMLIEESSSPGPVLFNTRIPHKALSTGDKTRYGLTVRFKEQYSSWEDTVNVFRPWIGSAK